MDKFYIGVVALIAACCSYPAVADMISPQVESAEDRLRENPNAYDRVDDLCTGKKPGASCSIPGGTFAGGGEGTCINAYNERENAIDLSCTRIGDVEIDRKLPAGGFVADDYLCALDGAERAQRLWNCRPLKTVPADRFCKDKSVGSRCTVQLTYRGKAEQHDGVCAEVTETERFYYQGPRVAEREVIRCEPPLARARTYTPVSWWQKLFQ